MEHPDISFWIKMSALFIGGGVVLGIILSYPNDDKENYENPKNFLYANIVMWILWIVYSILYWGLPLIIKT